MKNFWKKKKIFSGDPDDVTRRRMTSQKNRIFEISIEYHHVTPRWIEEINTSILAKKSSKNITFDQSYAISSKRRHMTSQF